MASLLSTPGLDTCLARLLHKQGRLDLQALLGLLAQARREPGGGTLAERLARQGLVPEAELAGYLAEASQAVAETVSPAPVPIDQGWKPGLAVDGLVIDRELGSGGMGAVYVAQDSQTGARYAVKTLHPGAGPEEMLRFKREGEAQAAVDRHPNVVRVHRVGHGAGRSYLVMDLAAGGDLQSRLKMGPLEPRVAATLARDLARGLAHVHRHGVLHRDLKPANVVFGDRDEPKLMDFGLARLEGAETLTQSGTILGTPGYMAPEQVDGKLGAVTATADVYGLGAVLYHCLTGRAPFSGSLYATLLAVLNAPPTPPGHLVPQIPPGLEAICLRALGKGPGERPPNADALADELDSFLSSPARPRTLSPLRVGAVAALILIVGALASTLRTGPASVAAPRQDVTKTVSDAAPPPQEPTPPETSKPRLSETELWQLANSIAAIRSSLVAVRTHHERLATECVELLDLDPPPEIQKIAALGLVDAAYARSDLGTTEAWTQCLIDAKRATKIVKNRRALAILARSHQAVGEFQLALGPLEQTIALASAANKPTALLLIRKADLHTELGQRKQALESLRAARSTVGGQSRGEVFRKLGSTLLALGDSEQALKAFDRLVQLSPNRASGYFHRGDAHQRSGNFLGAIDDYTSALKNNPGRHREAGSLLRRARCYEVLALPEKAKTDLRRCIDINDEASFALAQERLAVLER